MLSGTALFPDEPPVVNNRGLISDLNLEPFTPPTSLKLLMNANFETAILQTNLQVLGVDK